MRTNTALVVPSKYKEMPEMLDDFKSVYAMSSVIMTTSA
jgi:hypothetical protein